MQDEYIRQGETFESTVTDGDDTASTLTFTISDDQNNIVKTVNSNFAIVDGKSIATISFQDDSLQVGTYHYMYRIDYTNGGNDKFPDPASCDDGSCELPKFIVCEANDIVS